MARFAGATFKMGAPSSLARDYPDAEPQHDATVGPYYLDKTEFAGADKLPVVGKTWAEADQLCKDAGKRLPTQAEWEYAARSGKLDPKKAALLRKKTAPVGSHKGDCTPDGVCDLLGNVMEWTADDAKGKPGMKVVRGGSIGVGPTDEYYASIHARVPYSSSEGNQEIGFRCALDAPAE